MSSETGPVEIVARPPGLAVALVRAAMTERVKDEAVAAFGEEFSEQVVSLGKVKAIMWAYGQGWEVFYRRYETLFQLLMIILAIVGFVAIIV